MTHQLHVLLYLGTLLMAWTPGRLALDGSSRVVRLSKNTLSLPHMEYFTDDVSSDKVASKRADKRQSKPGLTTTPPSPPEEDSAVLYTLGTDGGGNCIMLSVDGIVEFQFTTKLNERQSANTFIPASATVLGDCTGEDEQSFIMKWKSFVLIWYFSKTPGGERWYVAKIELKYDSTDHMLAHIKDPGRTYTLTSTHNGKDQLMFVTPVGMSYRCRSEIEVLLDNPKITDTTATLLLRDLKLEPFIFKNDFGPEYMCQGGGAGGSYRSETAPLVVGSILASATLITISGYALFRYFKIKKVQYDTME